MKRTFADLHLRVNGRDMVKVNKLASKSAELGYKLVGTPLPPETKPQEIRELQTSCADIGVDFVSRVDLYPRSPAELLAFLRRLRRKFEIICVLCEHKEIARQAAKDRRVDLLNFPQLDYRRRFFDRAEAELASSSVAGMEVDIKPLLILEGPPRIRFLSWLHREVALALEFKVPIVISSGVSDLLFLRKPREMAVLSSLFGLRSEERLDAVSLNPAMLVERNREKLQSGFVAPGIRLIREGENC